MLTTFIYVATLLATIDGDTFKARVEVWPGVEVVTNVRVLGIDTPELNGKCVQEKTAAQVAKKQLAQLLQGKRITIREVTLDKYAGRVDAFVEANGEDVAVLMVEGGFARQYMGGLRGGWC